MCVGVADDTLTIFFEIAFTVSQLKTYIMVTAWVKKFFSSVDLIARKHNKLVLGLSFILRLHAGDSSLAKYWDSH